MSSFVGDFTLMTILTEVESILNNRPLTPLSNDIEDFECLTPNHFLLGRQNSSHPWSLRKQWRQSQYLREYLPNLQIRQKWNVEQQHISAGDLVLVVEDKEKLSKLKTGRIESVMPGHVRVARVKTSTSFCIRPSAKLCLLEEH